MSQVIYNRDSTTVPTDYVKHFDVMIADLPYREHVHSAATSQSAKGGTRKRELGFDSLTEVLRAKSGEWAAAVKRWSILYSDVEDSYLLRHAAEANGAEYIRTLPWVRWSMPQLSGDRPPQGFEHVLCLHAKGKKKWNGPGNLIELKHLALRGEEKHKCEKPLDQALDLVSFFSDIGESIFDPCAGHGTIGVACRLLGRHYVGFEYNLKDPQWAERAQKRILAPSDTDFERIVRWLESSSEPVSSLLEGPSLIRAAARAQDKENVKRGVFL